MGFKWSSKYSDIFPVGVPLLEMTGRPSTSYSYCVSKAKDSFSRLVEFLKLYEKYLHSSGEIHFSITFLY